MKASTKIFLIACVLVFSALVTGSLPTRIGRPYDFEGLLSTLFLAVIVAVIGFIKRTREKKSNKKEPALRFNSRVTCIDCCDWPIDVVVEFDDNTFTVIRKGSAPWILFGAVGSALSSGKEVMKFPISEIKACEFIEKGWRIWLSVDLAGGHHVDMTMDNAARELLTPLLQKPGA